MKRYHTIILLIIIGIAAIPVIISYFADQDMGNQEMSVTCVCGSRPIMPAYDSAALAQFQKLFQSKGHIYKQNKINDAMSLYKKTLHTMPQISHTLERLGQAYAKQGNHDNAIAAYNTAVSLNPSNPSTLILLCLRFQETQQEPLAINSSTTVLHYAPDVPPAFI